MLTKQITIFIVLFVIFALATGNIGGTFIGCVVNAILYQWSNQYAKTS